MAEFERKDSTDPTHGDTLRAKGSVNQRFAENAVVAGNSDGVDQTRLMSCFQPLLWMFPQAELL